jgi:hypothetical protein
VVQPVVGVVDDDAEADDLLPWKTRHRRHRVGLEVGAAATDDLVGDHGRLEDVVQQPVDRPLHADSRATTSARMSSSSGRSVEASTTSTGTPRISWRSRIRPATSTRDLDASKSTRESTSR